MKSKIYQIHIELQHSKPKIWRRLLISSDVLLPNLHEIIQIAMGWENCHLHQFIHENNFYGVPFDDYDEIIDYKKIKLNKFIKNEKDKCFYEYDFGDSWVHQITLEKIVPFDEKINYPICLTGKMACPPEDCGGIWGYSNLLEILKDPTHEEYEDMIDWVDEDFDPTYFDKDEINEELE